MSARTHRTSLARQAQPPGLLVGTGMQSVALVARSGWMAAAAVTPASLRSRYSRTAPVRPAEPSPRQTAALSLSRIIATASTDPCWAGAPVPCGCLRR